MKADDGRTRCGYGLARIRSRSEHRCRERAAATAPQAKVSAAQCGLSLTVQRTRSSYIPAGQPKAATDTSAGRSGAESSGSEDLKARMHLELSTMFAKHMMGSARWSRRRPRLCGRTLMTTRRAWRRSSRSSCARDEAISSLQVEAEQLRGAQAEGTS